MTGSSNLAVVGLATQIGDCETVLALLPGLQPVPWRRPAVGMGTWFPVANGGVLILAPESDQGELGSAILTGATWLGTVVCDPDGPGSEEFANALVQIAADGSEIKVAVAGTSAGPGSAPSPHWEAAIDHVAYGVPDLGRAHLSLQAKLGQRFDMGCWKFPVLGAMSTMTAANGAYIELNMPDAEGGFFGSAAERGDGRPAFVCLRVNEVERVRRRLREADVHVSQIEDVVCAPARTQEPPKAIARVCAVDPAATSGLAFMLVETGWPWEDRRAWPNGAAR